jgi:hypothetical protein
VSHLPNGTIHSQKSHRPSTSMAPRPPATTNGLSLDLPVDDEDYLMPSPQSPFQVPISHRTPFRPKTFRMHFHPQILDKFAAKKRQK